jgi:hypothetical protein
VSERGCEWISLQRRRGNCTRKNFVLPPYYVLMVLSHPVCEAVLIIEENRVETRLDIKTETCLVSKTLSLAGDLQLRGFELY